VWPRGACAQRRVCNHVQADAISGPTILGAGFISAAVGESCAIDLLWQAETVTSRLSQQKAWDW